MNHSNPPIDIHFDMETGDPDDACTLLILIGHPAYRLRSVSVTPGTDEQIGMVKHILHLTGHEIVPVGSARPGYEKNCVSRYYYNWFGNFEPTAPEGKGLDIFLDSLNKWPKLVLLTGAPLKNFHEFPENIHLSKWVAQGGFAGDNVVPEAYRLEKFSGMETCPTYNFNGDVNGAFQMLNHPNVGSRYLVSKNVCHGMVYDQDFHASITKVKHVNRAYEWLWKGMELYLAKRPEGKKFHDPLAAAVVVRPEICEFREVEIFRERGKWGSKLMENTDTWISISANRDEFIRFLTEIEGE